MGIGIWSMHFTGMMAYSLPVLVQYAWPTVLVSLIVAIAASAFALYVVSRKTMPRIRAFGSGIAMGAAIAGLHYIAMAAMRFTGVMEYDLVIVSVSVFLAIGFSLIALWLAFYFRNEPENVAWQKIGSALVMGVGVAAMHYTAMAAASAHPFPRLPDLSHSVTISSLETTGMIAITLVVLGVAILYSAVDRRFDALGVELAFAEARTEMARAARIATIGELSASLAHEINQPLAAVVTDAEALVRWISWEPVNFGEVRSAAERIVREANRAGEIISKVRSLIKKQSPRMEELKVNEIITEVLDLAQREVARANIAVQVELSSEDPLARGDRVQLHQVVLNLILNGIDAMAEVSEKHRTLIIKSENRPEGVMISIQDSGLGVNTRDAEQIFEPFFTTKPEGVGIGLSISRSIVEAHGGRLWVTPGFPRGAVFQFVLPRISDRT
jgi:signal transduction histidine kinase